MADLLFITVTVAFFGVAGLLVKVCDHIIGPEQAITPAEGAEPEEVAA